MTNKIKSIIYKGLKYKFGGNVKEQEPVSLVEYATISSVGTKLSEITPECNWDESRILALESAIQALQTRVDNASSDGSGDFATKGVYKFTVWGNADTMSVKINYTTTITVQNGVETDISQYAPITSCHNMFDDANMTKIDVSKLDVSEVTNMDEMFRAGGNYELTEIIGLTKMDTSSCTSMGNMFINFGGSELDCSKFDTSKVNNMSGMFAIFRSSVVIHADNFSCASSPNFANIFYSSNNYTVYTNQEFKDYMASKGCINHIYLAS